MKSNMGSLDRTARLIASVVFVILYTTETVTGNLAWILLVLAVIFTATSFIRFCPLYLPFNMDTRSEDEKK